jgi:N-acetylgalactosamine-6-sulfatase
MVQRDERPNIVFVFADDWGWGDLGCYGNGKLKTPNLDALASAGALFTQFYVTSGVCSPSRASVLTGRFPARLRIHGHFASHEWNAKRGMVNWLDPEEYTYMRLLRQAGYAVGHFGKWHCGHGEGAPEPFAYGVDECKVNAGNGPQLGYADVYRWDEPFLRGDEAKRLRPGPRTKSSETIVNEAMGFIDRHRDGPFLVNVWLNDTHATLDPDPQMLERYEHLMPQGVQHKHVGAPAIYCATVTEADRQVGRLLARLDELKLTDNTLVIFSADNGPEDMAIRNAGHSGFGSPGPFRGRKRSLYEGGVRTPFIVRWPGRTPAGRVDDDTVLSGVDLLPTFCTAAGVNVPASTALDGQDMSAALTGRGVQRDKPLLWEWRFSVAGHCINKSPMLAIRRDNWKLLTNPDGGRAELFDIPADPMEVKDRADAEPEVVQRLRDEVLAWQAELPEGPVNEWAGRNDYPWPGTEL